MYDNKIELGLLCQVGDDATSYYGYSTLSHIDELKDVLQEEQKSITNHVLVDISVLYYLDDMYQTYGYTQQFAEEIEEIFMKQLILNHVVCDNPALA